MWEIDEWLVRILVVVANLEIVRMVFERME